MLTYQDRFTGKTFTVANNQVTDQYGNVATIPATEWVKMQESDIVLVDGVDMKDIAYFWVNEQGKRIQTTFTQRQKAHKVIAKAFSIKWREFTERYDANSRMVLLVRLIRCL